MTTASRSRTRTRRRPSASGCAGGCTATTTPRTTTSRAATSRTATTRPRASRRASRSLGEAAATTATTTTTRPRPRLHPNPNPPLLALASPFPPSPPRTPRPARPNASAKLHHPSPHRPRSRPQHRRHSRSSPSAPSCRRRSSSSCARSGGRRSGWAGSATREDRPSSVGGWSTCWARSAARWNLSSSSSSPSRGGGRSCLCNAVTSCSRRLESLIALDTLDAARKRTRESEEARTLSSCTLCALLRSSPSLHLMLPRLAFGSSRAQTYSHAHYARTVRRRRERGCALGDLRELAAAALGRLLCRQRRDERLRLERQRGASTCGAMWRRRVGRAEGGGRRAVDRGKDAAGRVALRDGGRVGRRGGLVCAGVGDGGEVWELVVGGGARWRVDEDERRGRVGGGGGVACLLDVVRVGLDPVEGCEGTPSQLSHSLLPPGLWEREREEERERTHLVLAVSSTRRPAPARSRPARARRARRRRRRSTWACRR